MCTNQAGLLARHPAMLLWAQVLASIQGPPQIPTSLPRSSDIPKLRSAPPTVVELAA